VTSLDDRAARVLVPSVAAASLIVGFAVAQVTGQRWLGAIVLLAGGGYCAAVMLPRRGVLRTVCLAAVYLGSFVLSHPLGKAVGSWVAVVIVAAVTGLAGYLLMRPTGRRVSSTTSPARSTR